eukprot:4579869-Alexandrium_andersonii.AAC.1
MLLSGVGVASAAALSSSKCPSSSFMIPLAPSSSVPQWLVHIKVCQPMHFVARAFLSMLEPSWAYTSRTRAHTCSDSAGPEPEELEPKSYALQQHEQHDDHRTGDRMQTWLKRLALRHTTICKGCLHDCTH